MYCTWLKRVLPPHQYIPIVRNMRLESHYLTGFLLLAYIYAIDLQELEDVAVRRNIAKDTSWVRDRVKAFVIACALGFRREFEPRNGIAIRFDPRGHRGSFFCRFLPEPIAVILLTWPILISAAHAHDELNLTPFDKYLSALNCFPGALLLQSLLP